MQNEQVLELAIMAAKMQIAIQLLGVMKALIELVMTKRKAKAEKTANTEKDPNRRKRSGSRKIRFRR